MIHSFETVVVGSAFYAIPIGAVARLEFKESEVIVSVANSKSVNVHYAEIIEIGIHGPGKTVSGGGFVGGGSGIEGAIVGIATSALLNAATTKTNLQTFISMKTMIGELHFLCSSFEPNALRFGLAHVYSAVRHFDLEMVNKYLDKLNNLYKAGLVTEEKLGELRSGFDNKHHAVPQSGYLISSVTNDGAAKKAGINVGDLVVQYNDVAISSDENLSSAIKAASGVSRVLIVRCGCMIALHCEPGRLGIDGQMVHV